MREPMTIAYIVEYTDEGTAELWDPATDTRICLEPSMVLAVWAIHSPRYPEELPIRWGKDEHDV